MGKISSDELTELSASVISRLVSPGTAERYLLWRRARNIGRPIEIFSPEQRDHEKPGKGVLKELKHCFFSYIPGRSFDGPVRPLVLAPLNKDKKTFDPKPLNGKAVVMLSDISVHTLDINEDGVVMFKGKDLFDPKQDYWEGKAPEVKYPE